MKKNDYSKCPKCGEQVYMYVGNTEIDQYECYSINNKGEQDEQIEILMGSRMDRVDYVEDKTSYTCDLGLAQGVSDEFESQACGETTYNSLQELKYSVDYYSIIERKQEADDLSTFGHSRSDTTQGSRRARHQLAVERSVPLRQGSNQF